MPGQASRPRETGARDSQRVTTCCDMRAVGYAWPERYGASGDEHLVNFDVGMQPYKSGLPVGSGMYVRTGVSVVRITENVRFSTPAASAARTSARVRRG